MAITPPSQIIYDISSFPPVIQSFVTQLDNDISSGWLPDDTMRQLSYSWSNYGGYTQGKLDLVNRILLAYKVRGWNCYTFRNRDYQTTLKIVFELPTP